MTASGVRTARVVAQAKVNLFLRVLAREASGYHQLETLFQRLELGDEVVVRTGVSGRTLDCTGADVGPTERNLAWRAAEAYIARTGWPNGFAIEIVKRIPVGGGLGGGSADAGAVLRCLDALNPAPIGAHELLAIGVRLGADVPFLTSTHALALAWGRGERMLALTPLPSRRVHLALFDTGVATADAFRALAESRGDDVPHPIVWTTDRFARWDDVALVASNDLERVVFSSRADVAEMRQALTEIARSLDAAFAEASDRVDGDETSFALMTGSGATIYLITPERDSGLTTFFQPTPDSGPPRYAISETRTATRVAEVIVDE